MMVDSGIVRLRPPSRSTGNLPMGQTFLKAAAEAGSMRSTMCGSKAVSFS